MDLACALRALVGTLSLSLTVDGFDQAGPVVARIAHRNVHPEPFEYFGRFTLQQYHLLGPALACRRVKPLTRQRRVEHHRPAVVDVDHAAGAVGGDDHKPIVLARALIGVG